MKVGLIIQRVRELDRSSRTLAKTRNRRQLRRDERAERIDQNVLVVNVTTIQRVLRVDAIVDAQQVFAIVERVWLLERDVVADRAVCECGRETDRRLKDVRDGTAISRDPVRRNDVSQRDVVAAETTGSIRRCGNSSVQ